MRQQKSRKTHCGKMKLQISHYVVEITKYSLKVYQLLRAHRASPSGEITWRNQLWDIIIKKKLC